MVAAALTAALLFATPAPELTLIYQLGGTDEISLDELHARVRGALIAHTVYSVAEHPRLATPELAKCRAAPACLRTVPGIPSGQLLFVSIEAFSTSDLVVMALVDPSSGVAPARRGRPTDGRPSRSHRGGAPRAYRSGALGFIATQIANRPERSQRPASKRSIMHDTLRSEGAAAGPSPDPRGRRRPFPVRGRLAGSWPAHQPRGRALSGLWYLSLGLGGPGSGRGGGSRPGGGTQPVRPAAPHPRQRERSSLDRTQVSVSEPGPPSPLAPALRVPVRPSDPCRST